MVGVNQKLAKRGLEFMEDSKDRIAELSHELWWGWAGVSYADTSARTKRVREIIKELHQISRRPSRLQVAK